MRVGALVVGILGSIGAFIGASCVVAGGAVLDAFGEEEGAEIAGQGFLGFGASVLGLVGAAIAIAKPRTASVLMLVAAVVGLIVNGGFFIPGAILLGIGSLLAFLGRNEKKAAL